MIEDFFCQQYLITEATWEQDVWEQEETERSEEVLAANTVYLGSVHTAAFTRKLQVLGKTDGWDFWALDNQRKITAKLEC